MLFQDILSLAVENLKRRIFRTSLTVVGVVIGTMSVVLMSSLGFAVSASMMESYSSLRLRTIDVYLAADPDRPEISMPITSEIIADISQLPGVVSSYGVYEAPLEIKVGRHSASVLVVGLPAEAYGVLDFVYADGGPPVEGAQLKLLYGAKVSQTLFWDENNPDEIVDIDLSQALALVSAEDTEATGVAVGKPGDAEPTATATKNPPRRISASTAGVLYEDPDEWGEHSTSIFADQKALITALKKLSPGKPLPGQKSVNSAVEKGTFIFTKATIIAQTPKDAEVITQHFRDLHYTFSAPIEYMKEAQKQMFIVQAVLGGIGFVSLLVAAIGIANTMLMSVYERTKEIGVMKVLGASLRDIRKMFLIEASTIGFIGGLCGVLLSYAISMALNSFEPIMAGTGGNKISIIPPLLAGSAVAGATLIGTLSGIAPAYRAMRLSPLTAIRTQ